MCKLVSMLLPKSISGNDRGWVGENAGRERHDAVCARTIWSQDGNTSHDGTGRESDSKINRHAHVHIQIRMSYFAIEECRGLLKYIPTYCTIGLCSVGAMPSHQASTNAATKHRVRSPPHDKGLTALPISSGQDDKRNKRHNKLQ